MKASNKQWRERLMAKMPPHYAQEIDQFETEIELKKQAKLDDRIFAETRLRRGAYGQRYDNGQRLDGIESRKLEYPSPQTKGPHTLWDAPGMQRIKVPFGGLNSEKMEEMGEWGGAYSDGVAQII